MVQALSPSQVTMTDLMDRFNVRWVEDPTFFPEWQGEPSACRPQHQDLLDQVKANFRARSDAPQRPERTVQLSVLSPILFLAGLYAPPFKLQAEESVAFHLEDQGVEIRGVMDILVLKERLWVLVIESKRPAGDVELGVAQLLAYMLGNPEPERPGFGLITNGNNFMFVKLVQQATEYCYATSRLYSLRNPGNELYDVYRILVKLGQLSV